jgi:N-acetylglucosamine kinase-like BadF-type ATPase
MPKFTRMFPAALELPWIILDEGSAMVLADEDVPHARRTISRLRRDADALAERLMDMTGEQIDIDDLAAAARAEADELVSSWERLAYLVPKLSTMLRSAEAAGSAVAIVFG